MSTGGGDRLVVSAVNGGGVLLVDAGGVAWLSAVDTTGVVESGGALLLARQSGESNELRVVDRDGDLRRVVVASGVQDLHDVVVHDGRVHVACTQANAVLRLAGDDLVLDARWDMGGEPDACHLNALCSHAGRLLATCFGRFDRHRGYKGRTRGAGEAFDVETGEVVLSGLSQPHSLSSRDGDLWVCDSEAYALRRFRDGRQIAEVALGGYARGLAFGHDAIYVGLSRGRNDPASALARAAIVVLDPETLVERTRIQLPVDEVYAIVPTTLDDDALRRGGIADLRQEVAETRHARNVAASRVHALESDASAAESAVHAANMAAIAASRAAQAEHRRATFLLDDLREHRIRLDDAAAWSEALEAGAGDQSAHVAQLDDAIADRDRALAARIDAAAADAASIDALAGAVAALQAHVAQVEGSRSWRWTRWLRRVEPVAPQVPAITASVPPAMPPPVALPAPVPPARASLAVPALSFEVVDAPRVSIIVTAYGRFTETAACLRAIAAGASGIPYEVILAEDASGEAEMARFASVPGLRYVPRERNLGYLRSVNDAARLARGEYLHLLNNDTRVQPGWLEALLEATQLVERCGMVGSKLVFPDGRLQEAGGIVWSDGGAMNEGRGDDPGGPAYSAVREVDYASAASVLLRRDLFDSLGGFDERYAPAYYEDTDLAFRVRAAGLKVCLQPTSVVLHDEGLSHGTDESAGGKVHQVRNAAVFRERWREELDRAQCAPGELHALARERSQLRRRVLVVDRHAPRTDRDAGSRAIWQLMRVLGGRGFEVKFWSADADEPAGYADALRRHGIEFLSTPEVGVDLPDWLRDQGALLDYVVLSRPHVARRMLAPVRTLSDARVVYYGHDLHHLRMAGQAAATGDAVLAAHAAAMRTVERGIWEASDLVLYPAASETTEVAAWLGEGGGTAIARTVPLFAYAGASPVVDPADAALRGRRDVLFVGGFGHAPNEDGLRWFARDAWPRIRTMVPEARLVVVGADPTPEILALAGDDIVVAGLVSEATLHAHYAAARVAVVPLRFGAGLKGKVLEAMWHGVPCVTTSVGADGFEAAVPDVLRVADDPEALANAVAVLFVDDAAWRACSAAGQALAERDASPDAVWRVLSETLDATPYPDMLARREAVARVRARVPG